MRSPELHRAVDYTKNVISHTFGIPSYQESRKAYRREFRDGFAKVAASMGAFSEIAMPITSRMAVLDNDYDRIPSKHEGVKFLGGFAVDSAAFAASGYLIATGKVAEGIGLRLAYNAASVVTPDVLKSMKNTLGRFKGQPPTAAFV
ncbi:MAG: hypothetical protein M1365_08735 [Actinobacteria bacterium]|nr:hypothetical protein [Actinomycetota bacterium]